MTAASLDKWWDMGSWTDDRNELMVEVRLSGPANPFIKLVIFILPPTHNTLR
jgi:hypothetical protein